MNFSRERQAEQRGGHNNPDLPQSNKVTRSKKINNINAWVKKIWYYRTHIDVFIEEYLSHPDKPIKLFPFQKVILRQYGLSNFIDDIESRALGKTFKAALGLFSLAILYPKSPILVVSKTSNQALLVLKYIDGLVNTNPNFAREIEGKVQIQKDKGTVFFKNGSVIEARAMSVDGSNLRGLRAKVIYIDESCWVKNQVVKEVLMPILQYKRDTFWASDGKFEDYQSKLIQTTSAYLKSCDYFERFKNNVKDFKNGEGKKFVCAIPYTVGVRYGIIDEDFVLNEKKSMPLNAWEMEWNAKFIGTTEGSAFPYDLTEPCRTLREVELIQPRRSTSRYVITLDVATSVSTYSDNACLCVIKFSKLSNGKFIKNVVNIRSYHGNTLEELAREVRLYHIRFPNTEKIIIDINAIGEGILSLLNSPFVDSKNREHLPLLLEDTERGIVGNRIIKGIKADNKYNNRIATAMRLFLENKSLHIPVSFYSFRREQTANNSMEESAIFAEADALQYEMGNIVKNITNAGNVVYDTNSKYLHKDRYISLGMGIEYIYTLEQDGANIKDNENIYMGGAYVL